MDEIVEMLVFQGTLVHATEETPLEILPDHLIGIHDGKVWNSTSKGNGLKRFYAHT